MHRTSSLALAFAILLAACLPLSAQTGPGVPQPGVQANGMPAPGYAPNTQRLITNTQQPMTGQVAQAAEVGRPLAQVANVPQQPGTLGPPAQALAMVAPPFQLTAVEQQFVDQILQMWENKSAEIKTFNSRFERWEYDEVFGPGNQIPFTKSTGQLTYSKPDKGSFKIEEIRRWAKQDPNQKTWQPGDWKLQKEEIGEHWVCDGKAVYEYDSGKRELKVQLLPPEMQGKSIVDGPLPFLFGAEAAKLKRRYWIRSKQGSPEQIWLEAYPRRQEDRANYHHVEVILDRKSMQPQAIKVHEPNNQSHSVYMFKDPTVNGTLNALFGNLFSAPRTPLGWTRIVVDPPTGPPANPQAANPQPTIQK